MGLEHDGHPFEHIGVDELRQLERIAVLELGQPEHRIRFCISGSGVKGNGSAENHHF